MANQQDDPGQFFQNLSPTHRRWMNARKNDNTNYFTEKFDPSLPVILDEIHETHIVRDNWQRFLQGLPHEKHLTFSVMSDKEKREYLNKCISYTWRELSTKPETALPNYYFPRGDISSPKCQFLIPAWCNDIDPAFMAIVIGKVSSSFYNVYTWLTLKQAYANTGLIAVPQKSWCDPNNLRRHL